MILQPYDNREKVRKKEKGNRKKEKLTQLSTKSNGNARESDGGHGFHVNSTRD